MAFPETLRGNLNQPYTMTALPDFTFEGIIRGGQFPTPPSALAFLVDPFAESDIELAFSRIHTPYAITGALFPESDYLEPTTGQIWPR